MNNVQPVPIRHTNPDPGYRGGALLKANLPKREIIDGQTVQTTEQVTVLKNVKIRYANPIKPMQSDPTRVFGYAFGQMKPGRMGSIGITGFDKMAPIVAGFKSGQVVSCVGQVNFRDGKSFFEVERLVEMGTPAVQQEVAPAAEAPKAKRSRKPAATAAPAPAPADAADDATDDPSF